jgi:hypothetical protein
MTVSSRIYFSIVLASALLAACGSGDGNSTPDATADTDPTDGGGDIENDATSDTLDTSTPDAVEDVDDTTPDADTSGPDTSETDGTDGSPDDVLPDLADADDTAPDVEDADPTDVADTSDAETDVPVDPLCDFPECEYLDLDIWLVSCGGTWEYGRTFSDVCNRPACAAGNWVVLDGERYDSVDDAYTAKSCEPQCELRAATSASFVHCDRRNGYIVFESPEPSCAALYEFSDGLFNSYEEWLEAHPCD